MSLEGETRRLWARILLVGLAWSAALVGFWATFAPRSFYDSFPGGGRQWVAPDGPYNHHLVSDVGELNLALLVVTLAALLTLNTLLVRTTAVAWLVYGVPHFLYHATHTDPFSTGDVAATLLSLSLAIIAPVALLVLSRPSIEAETPEPAAA